MSAGRAQVSKTSGRPFDTAHPADCRGYAYMEAFARVRPASVPSLAKALGPTSLAVPPGLPRRRGFSRLLDNDLTLVVKILDPSQPWNSKGSTPASDRSCRGIGLARAGASRVASASSRSAPRIRSGSPQNRPFPSSFYARALARGPNLFAGGEEICCIGSRKVEGSNPSGGAQVLP